MTKRVIPCPTTVEEFELKLPLLALKALYKTLREKKTTPTKLQAANFVLGRTLWREAPKQEFHLHITQEQIAEAKRKQGLLPPK